MPDHAADLPSTRQACRVRLAGLADDMTAIKMQIAAADLKRQRRHGMVDPQQFQEWRAALRGKQREIERLTRHMRRCHPSGMPSRIA